MSTLYTASAMATGDGRNGQVASSDGLVQTELAVPTEMGGPGGATNPEQLFAAGYAACFHSALKLVADKQKVELSDSSVTADVSLTPDGQGFKLGVGLEVEIAGVDESTARSLAEAAHQVCPYSHATRGNIEVDLAVTAA